MSFRSNPYFATLIEAESQRRSWNCVVRVSELFAILRATVTLPSFFN